MSFWMDFAGGLTGTKTGAESAPGAADGAKTTGPNVKSPGFWKDLAAGFSRTGAFSPQARAHRPYAPELERPDYEDPDSKLGRE